MVPLNCGVFSLWVGLDQWLVNVSWMWELVSVLCWVELNLFSLECHEISSSEFWGVYGFDMALGSLSFYVQDCVFVLQRIIVVYLALELVGSWVELHFSVGMETFGWALVY